MALFRRPTIESAGQPEDDFGAGLINSIIQEERSMGAEWEVEADPVELAMREILRPSNAAAGPNPIAVAAADQAREILRPSHAAALPNPIAVAAADQAREILEPPRQKPIEVEKSRLPKLASLPRDRGISLRWTLRDIDRKRTKFSPVSPEDLKLLTELGLVEIMDDGTLWLTSEGHREIG